MPVKDKKRILILCTGNSCRSQMAEGVLRYYGHDRFEVFSAGIAPSLVNPVAIEVMKEIGIDISGQRSKHVDEFRGRKFDYVITVCDNAGGFCPSFGGIAKKLHWSFPDPPHEHEATPETVNKFREVRDLIHEKFRHAAETLAFE